MALPLVMIPKIKIGPKTVSYNPDRFDISKILHWVSRVSAWVLAKLNRVSVFSIGCASIVNRDKVVEVLDGETFLLEKRSALKTLGCVDFDCFSR